MIVPSIDIMDGKAVQLKQGKIKVLEQDNVIGLAKTFSKYGEIAVIDLDAVLGNGENSELIKEICSIADCRVGGGIRTIKKANEILSAGAKKIIIGTMASPEFLKQLPKDRIIVAIDTKDGKVVDKGWTRKLKKKPEELIKDLDNFCSEFLFTNVNKEGMMSGLDFKIVNQLVKLTNKKITVAGGVTTINDIRKLESTTHCKQWGMLHCKTVAVSTLVSPLQEVGVYLACNYIKRAKKLSTSGFYVEK